MEHGVHCRYPRFVVKVGPCKTALGHLVPLLSYSVGRVNGVFIHVVPNHTVMTYNNPLGGIFRDNVDNQEHHCIYQGETAPGSSYL
jgi:hypothetical protein